ncbi:zinc finger protein 219-like [Anguilla rostrata]|uniref:zinc finger protein 219-like n=1 Tax=Anguilla rostrata TaxID=7938 RepID=UPI0030D3BD22
MPSVWSKPVVAGGASGFGPAVEQIPASELEAGERLVGLRQGSRTLTEYATEFRALAPLSGWCQEDLCVFFQHGLRDTLQGGLISFGLDQSSDLEALMASALCLETYIQEHTEKPPASPRAPEKPPASPRAPERLPAPPQVQERPPPPPPVVPEGPPPAPPVVQSGGCVASLSSPVVVSRLCPVRWLCRVSVQSSVSATSLSSPVFLPRHSPVRVSAMSSSSPVFCPALRILFLVVVPGPVLSCPSPESLVCQFCPVFLSPVLFVTPSQDQSPGTSRDVPPDTHWFDVCMYGLIICAYIGLLFTYILDLH